MADAALVCLAGARRTRRGDDSGNAAHLHDERERQEESHNSYRR
jgi:hypothetical protein